MESQTYPIIKITNGAYIKPECIRVGMSTSSKTCFPAVNKMKSGISDLGRSVIVLISSCRNTLTLQSALGPLKMQPVWQRNVDGFHDIALDQALIIIKHRRDPVLCSECLSPCFITGCHSSNNDIGKTLCTIDDGRGGDCGCSKDTDPERVLYKNKKKWNA